MVIYISGGHEEGYLVDSVVGFGVLAAAPDAPVAHDPTVVSRSTLLFSPCPNCEASCLFSSCSLATSTSLWGKLGNAGGFPHSTLG